LYTRNKMLQIDLRRMTLFVADTDHWLRFLSSSVRTGYVILRPPANVTHYAGMEKLRLDDPPAAQLNEALCKANSAYL